MSNHKYIVLFDGVCNLCNGSVNFIIRHDPKAKFQFAPIQSEAGHNMLSNFKYEELSLDTFIFIENETIYTKSTGALRVLKVLGGVWVIGYSLIIIPRFIRDYIYDKIAQSRYKIFGKKDECMMPNESDLSRFL